MLTTLYNAQPSPIIEPWWFEVPEQHNRDPRLDAELIGWERGLIESVKVFSREELLIFFRHGSINTLVGSKLTRHSHHNLAINKSDVRINNSQDSSFRQIVITIGAYSLIKVGIYLAN